MTFVDPPRPTPHQRKPGTDACVTDCAGCKHEIEIAAPRRLDEFNEAVLIPIYTRAARDGEWAIDKALRNIVRIADHMSEAKRDMALGSAARTLSNARPAAASKKPGKLPPGWRAFNRALVNDVAKATNAPKRNPGNETSLEKTAKVRSAFEIVSDLWRAHGVEVSAVDVFNYYRPERGHSRKKIQVPKARRWRQG